METLVELLRARAADPAYTPYVFLEDGERDARSITARELDARARAIASALPLQPGERALVLAPPGLDYIAAVFGCLYAGVVAVPVYPPDPRRLARTLPRLAAIARASGATAVVTTRAIAALGVVPLPAIAIDEAGDPGAWRAPDADGRSTALLQFTSGSTAAPRGVVLSHGNLIANLRAIRDAFELAARPPTTVSWLPPYHDMGLIGAILGSLYSGGTAVMMSPLHFLQQPVRWLRAITAYRADVSGGPNFAYDLCVRRADPAGLDLASWAIAFDGAEVVRSATLDRFAERFAPAGFRRHALLPCYGLAEATLLAAAVPRGQGPAVIEVDRAALERGEAVAGAGAALVSCGRPATGVELAIVDPATRRALPDDRIGEIWLAGPSVGGGYWDADSTAFGARIEPDGRGPFLRTGDLGFGRDGELFVTGRIKDLIIVRGRNLFPDDVERVAGAAHPALRPGATAAIAGEHAEGEELVIVQEVEPGELDRAAIRGAIRAAVAEVFDVAPRVVLVERGAIPKTSSGKIERHACRALAHDEASAAASDRIVG